VLANILIILLFLLSPQHDSHTSWMNMTYNEKNKEFDVTWRTDTEHLEGAIAHRTNDPNFHLSDTTLVPMGLALYLDENIHLSLNDKSTKLKIDIIEVNFAETIVHFKPIKCRRKLKSVSMTNTLLQAVFPNQKNMIQINYKGQMYSMLLGGSKIYDLVHIY
jgi:hypothetical protein